MSISTNHPHQWLNRRKGLSMVELIIVTVLFLILVPTSLAIFVGARKTIGQSYIQNQAAMTAGETSDIVRFMRNMDFDWLSDGSFYLIRNPGTGSWLVKNDLANLDLFERRVTVSSARRHTDTNDLFLEGDTGNSYVDPDTKKIDFSVVWAPDFLPLDLLSQTLYVTRWEKVATY